jgi:membrane-associated phospholipid phosphatase
VNDLRKIDAQCLTPVKITTWPVSPGVRGESPTDHAGKCPPLTARAGGCYLKAMLRRPFPRAVRGVALGLLLVVLAVPLDAIVHDLVFRHVVSHGVRLTANGTTQLGTVWVAAGLLGALAVVARRAGDPELWRASVGGLAGVAISSVATQVVKQVACRARPNLLDGWGVDPPDPTARATAGSRLAATFQSFFHWPCVLESRHHSFPSGHATTAFAVAAALTRAAPARRPLWLALAGIIGAARVLLNAHFLSDVIGGAIVGWWTGWLGIHATERYAVRTGSWPEPAARS